MPTIKELTEEDKEEILKFLKYSGKTTEQIEKKFKWNNTETIEVMQQLMPKVDFDNVPTKHGYQARWYLVLPP